MCFNQKEKNDSDDRQTEECSHSGTVRTNDKCFFLCRSLQTLPSKITQNAELLLEEKPRLSTQNDENIQ